MAKPEFRSNKCCLIISLVIAVVIAGALTAVVSWQTVKNKKHKKQHHNLTTIAPATNTTAAVITTKPAPPPPTNTTAAVITTKPAPPPSNVTYNCPLYPATQPMSADDLSQLSDLFKWLDNYISSTVDQVTRPSVAATIAYKNQIIWNGNFGTVKKGETKPPTSKTIYRIGSISKLFPSLMMFKLYDDGKIDLLDAVKKYAPTFKIGRPFGNKNEIKLIDIASQISGFPRSLPYDLLNPNGALIWNGTLEEALKILAGQIVVVEPRTECVYSNMAYPLLADILSTNFTSDRDFEKWCRENIVNPLGLQGTYFEYSEDRAKEMATGYTGTGDEAVQYDLLWYRPAGNYYSTSDDLVKLGMSLLEESNDKLLSHETLQTTLRPQMKCQSDYFFSATGSPWEVDYQHNRTIMRKDGDIAGYSSTLALVPEMKLILTVLMSGTRSENVAQKALNEVIPAINNVLRKKDFMLLPTPNAQKYVGLYEIANVQYWNVTADKDSVLYMTDIRQPPGRYKTMGLSFISDGVLQFTFLGGAFPCYLGTANLEVQNGSPVHFYNESSNVYHSFDMPGLSVYGFHRVETFSVRTVK